MRPLAKKVPVHIDTIRLAQVLGDEGADGGKVLGFEFMLILNVAELDRECFGRHHVHSMRL